MGFFIHQRDQIQQDSPPYGMAQRIHPISRTIYRTRRVKGMVCLPVSMRACDREGALNMLANEKRDVNRNLNRTVINVLQTQFLNK